MAQGDVTDDDPALGQVDTGGASAPTGAGPGGPPGGPPQPGGFLAAMARHQLGPQISAPGAGNQADSMIKIQQAIGLLTTAMQGLPPGQKLHTDVNRAIGALSRHLGGGMSAPGTGGAQITAWRDQMRDAVRNMMLHRIMSAQKGPQAGGDQQPAGGGLPGGAPMPSTPLPGA